MKTKPLRGRFCNRRLRYQRSAMALPCAIDYCQSPQVAILLVRTFFTSSRLRREAAPPGAARRCCSSGGERPSPPSCRSRAVKLGAAWSGWCRGGREQPW